MVTYDSKSDLPLVLDFFFNIYIRRIFVISKYFVDLVSGLLPRTSCDVLTYFVASGEILKQSRSKVKDCCHVQKVAKHI